MCERVHIRTYIYIPLSPARVVLIRACAFTARGHISRSLSLTGGGDLRPASGENLYLILFATRSRRVFASPRVEESTRREGKRDGRKRGGVYSKRGTSRKRKRTGACTV